jgi:signal transduction histidine kinase
MSDKKYANHWEAFVRLLAHDIKGPVGNTVMFSGMAKDQLDQLLEQQPELEPQLGMVQSLVANIETVNQKMMNQLQAWVESHEIQYHQMQWSIQQIDLQKVCEELKAINTTYLNKKQLVLEFHLQANRMRFDRDVLLRMLDILLTIFITYAEMDQTIKLVIKEEDDQRLRFALQDEMRLPRPELQERLQFDGEIPESHIPGNGILKPSDFGLLYIRKVCEAVGGSCGFNASEEGGSFWLSLPKSFQA